VAKILPKFRRPLSVVGPATEERPAKDPHAFRTTASAGLRLCSLIAAGCAPFSVNRKVNSFKRLHGGAEGIRTDGPSRLGVLDSSDFAMESQT
jgi:hypothetical protein